MSDCDDVFLTKTGDTSPITGRLKDKTGEVDLTGASVVFNMTTPDGTAKVDRGVCTIINPTLGYVKYEFQSADVDTAGSYRGEFEVTFVDTVVSTFPNDSYIPIKIISDLG